MPARGHQAWEPPQRSGTSLGFGPGIRLGATLAGIVLVGAVNLRCAASLPPRDLPEAGSYKQTTDIRVGGFHRTYRVHVPVGYDGSLELPLVVAIHGAFSGAEDFERQTDFSELADREGFVVVYPNGIGLFGLLRHWNSGHCCGKALKSGVDDVGFVADVVAEITSRFSIDPGRVYVVGYSNGGMLAHRIAAEAPFPIAAVAAVGSSIGGRPKGASSEWTVPEPEAPLPLMMVHGLADDRVPFDGSDTDESRGSTRTISVPRSIAFWVNENGCRNEPRMSREYEGRVERSDWSGCREGTAVTLLALKDWGHDWPGPFFIDRKDRDGTLAGFSAAEIIWDFLSGFERSQEIGP